MSDQRHCYWPSGREIRRLSIVSCLDLLAGYGVDGPQLQDLAKSDLRELIHRLKRESHDRGDCECPAAAYIRGGGGQAPGGGIHADPA